MHDLSVNWGRFSARGSDDFENKITKSVRSITEEFELIIPKEKCVALVLLGGYGRGEGGVTFDKEKEKPHNNLDLLLLTKNLDEEQTKKLLFDLNKKAVELSEKNEIMLDISAMPADKLTNASNLIIWYDMHHGHKTLIGDPQFISSLKQFTLETIPKWDALNLLVNRGALLIINDLILNQKPELTDDFKRLIIKHTMKAIIGFGDSLLFITGNYHWSYLEKLKRFESNEHMDSNFKKLYREAANFRLEARYQGYLQKDLKIWLKEIKQTLEAVMLEFERLRLRCPELNWQNYLTTASAFSLTDDISLKGLMKKIKNISVKENISSSLPMCSSFGIKSLNHSGRLALFFPLVAFGVADPTYRKFAKEFFQITNMSEVELTKKFLQYWGTHVDINFQNVVKKYGLKL